VSEPSRRTLLKGVAGVTVTGTALTGLTGGLPAVADDRHPRSCTTQVTTPKHELRAMWIASVVNIDWPSATGLSASAQQAELIGWLDLAAASRHNAVVLQVRPTADSFWPGALEPWSRYLTGTQGGDPGWDPLGFAVTEAHRRNLELHAWFNPFRVSMNTDVSALVEDHPVRQHPDWLESYGGKLYYNPGQPDARRFCVDAVMDAVTRYDIDAVHFDDYFYPYPVAGAPAFDDAAEYATYGDGRSLADWRRSNITDFIATLRRRMLRAKPWVQLGVSPFAVWRNRATDPQGSDTTAGVQTYDDLYADTRGWVRDGLLDYICPQVYWSRGFTAADYEKVTSWWVNEVRGRPVHLYIGQATYKVAMNADPAWDDPAELSSHLEYNATFGGVVHGNVYFSGKDVRADRLGATTLLNQTWYTRPALVPVTWWKDHSAPKPVQRLRRRGATLAWERGSRDAVSYAIYRFDGDDHRGGPDRCDLADASHLVATQRHVDARQQTWTDPTAANARGRKVTYVVTEVDRLGNESKPARVR